MGEYDHRKFRQTMVDAETYRKLDSMKRPGGTFADVIRMLLEGNGGKATK